MFAEKIINWMIPIDDGTDIDDMEIEIPEQKHNGKSDSIASESKENGDLSCEDDRASTPNFDTATTILQFNLDPELNSDIEEIQVRDDQLVEKEKIHSHFDGDKVKQGGIPFNELKLPVLYSQNMEVNSASTISASNAKNNRFMTLSSAAVHASDDIHAQSQKQTLMDNRRQRSIFTQIERNSPRSNFDVMYTPLVENQIQITPNFDCTTDKIRLLSEMDLSFKKAPVQSCSVAKTPPSECDVYGELLVIGCNGNVPDHLANHMDSRFVLKKRFRSNGVKEAHSFVRSHEIPLNHSPTEYRMSYNISESQSVVVEYVKDKSIDMFQIGRFESSPVDFRVLDISTRDRARNGVSRFACRILVQRHGNHEARVFAGAFDLKGNIFLGEGAQTWTREGKMDGFTTNGVLILNPKTNPYHWREVSVCGYVYPIRSANIDTCKPPRVLRESNILLDGTLIDLCGVTLLWRTPDGLRNTPSEDCLRRFEPMIRNLVPECYMLQEMPDPKIKKSEVQSYIFLSCGHVLAMDVSAVTEGLDGWSCPICRCTGPITKLNVGREPGFYIDRDVPSHAFRPCGHVSTFKTVQYWSSIHLLDHRHIQGGFCPFCGTKLSSITKYIELVYPQ